jgi:O-succinylbenzoic acid--CoA ligase
MKYENLKLNGKVYAKGDLLELTNEKLSTKKIKDEEKSLYSFIQEWLAPTETINLKTSGSTGAPKFITVKKTHMVDSAKMTCAYFGITAGTNALLCLSTDFIAGKMMVVRAFVSGCNLIVVEPSNNPLRRVTEKIDFVAMIPYQVQKVLNRKETKVIFDSIQSVIIGGAPVLHDFEKVLANCPNNVYATFAMTETLSHIALRKLSGKDRSEFFELLEGIKISKNSEGCMIVDAPMLSDTLIETNDIIEIADERHFKWLGRHDNVINSGGVKLYPERIEKKLSEVIKQNRFFIGSVKDAKFGEKVVMVVEGAANEDMEKIKYDVERNIEKYEKPRQYFTVTRFIETPNGKVKRKETLQMALDSNLAKI